MKEKFTKDELESAAWAVSFLMSKGYDALSSRDSDRVKLQPLWEKLIRESKNA